MNEDAHPDKLSKDDLSEPDLLEPSRLEELLADRALFGLDEAEQRELDALLSAGETTDTEMLDRVAAFAQLATLGQSETLPVELSQKLVQQGRQAVGASSSTEAGVGSRDHATLADSMTADSTVPTTPAPRREFLAWFAAAAAVAFAWFGMSPSPVEQSAGDLRAELLTQEDVTQIAWTAGADPAGKEATGDVVWHNGRQQGVMQFRHLAANDPTEAQYQLWIFDKAQDERYPVDGGVFDVPEGANQVLVKIDSKLPIVDPTLFAITIEKPGGVVVSSRERLPLLAQVE